MRRFILGLLIAATLPVVAGAVCTTTTGLLPLEIPRLGDSGAVWAACLQRNFEKLSNGGAGHATEDNGVPVVKRSTINFTGSGITITDVGGKTVIDIQGGTGDVIRSTTVVIAEVATTSIGWESVPGSTASVFTEVSAFLSAEFTCNLECDSFTTCPVNFGLLIDGDFADNITADVNTGIQFLKTDGMEVASPEPVSFRHRTELKVSASTHTLTLLWASPTGRSVRMARNTSGCSVTYSNELNVTNSGSLANVLGTTNFGAQTTASLRTLSCTALPCIAQTSDTAEIYRATGTLVGQWSALGSNTGP